LILALLKLWEMSEEFETSNPFAIFKEPLSVPLKLLNLYVMPKQIFYKSPS